MHPDAIIAGLRRELERLDRTADDYDDRRQAIEDELERVDGLPRPVAKPEDGATVFDQDRAYLAGLERELERADADRQDEIQAEIDRVKLELSSRPEGVEEAPAEAQAPAEEPPAAEPELAAVPAGASGGEPESGSTDAGQE